jgi:hypothetical protein
MGKRRRLFVKVEAELECIEVGEEPSSVCMSIESEGEPVLVRIELLPNGEVVMWQLCEPGGTVAIDGAGGGSASGRVKTDFPAILADYDEQM